MWHFVTERSARTGVLLTALWLSACSPGAGGAPGQTEPRYPEKRRPEPARSASDDQILGAHGQSPDDTLANSATQDRLAPGWEIEDGQLVRTSEGASGSQVAGHHNQPPKPAPCVKPGSSAAQKDAKVQTASGDAKGAGARAVPCPPEAPR